MYGHPGGSLGLLGRCRLHGHTLPHGPHGSEVLLQATGRQEGGGCSGESSVVVVLRRVFCCIGAEESLLLNWC